MERRAIKFDSLTIDNVSERRIHEEAAASSFSNISGTASPEGLADSLHDFELFPPADAAAFALARLLNC